LVILGNKQEGKQVTQSINLEVFVDYYTQFNAVVPAYLDTTKMDVNPTNVCINAMFKEEEVCKVIENLKNNKSCG
jgi:hypothetical protein